MDIKARLKKYALSKGLSDRAFAMRAGLASSFISSCKGMLTAVTINKLSVCYPDLNISWLLTGEGEMLRPEAEEAAAPAAGTPAAPAADAGLAALLAAQTRLLDHVAVMTDRLAAAEARAAAAEAALAGCKERLAAQAQLLADRDEFLKKQSAETAVLPDDPAASAAAAV